jgi:hypothetical protein
MGETNLKVVELRNSRKQDVVNCLRKALEDIEAGKLEPCELAFVIREVNPDKEDNTCTYTIRASGLLRSEMLWLFSIGTKHALGDNEEI